MSSPRALLALPVLLLLAAAALPATAAAGISAKVTNGVKVGDAQYQSHLQPLVALISLSERSQYDGQFCAGTLIDELHVLTAGHCLVQDQGLRTRMAPSSLGVLAGTRTLNDMGLNRTQLVGVDQIFVNPNFNIRTLRWDAAVLRLKSPITTVPTMPRLSPDESVALGMGSEQVMGLVAGWGDTNPRATDGCCFPADLRSARVPVQPDGLCEANLARASYVSFMTEFQFCAGKLSTGSTLGADSCQGDSGGPLIVDAAGGPRLAGVTSFGLGCGQRFYGVYARSTALAGWLDSIPGIPDGDTRTPSNGPGDLAAPSGSGSSSGYSAVRLRITPPASGTAPSEYTVWARVGGASRATDIFLRRTSATDLILPVPPTRSFTPYHLLVRPVSTFGEGPPASVRARPKVDRLRPSTPLRVATSRRGSSVTVTWRRSVDRQSGIMGYRVQRKVAGRWRKPTFGSRPSVRFNAGRGTGHVRVAAVDRAGNTGAWSTARAY